MRMESSITFCFFQECHTLLLHFSECIMFNCSARTLQPLSTAWTASFSCMLHRGGDCSCQARSHSLEIHLGLTFSNDQHSYCFSSSVWLKYTYIVGGPQSFELQVALETISQAWLKLAGQFSHPLKLLMRQQRAYGLQVLKAIRFRVP